MIPESGLRWLAQLLQQETGFDPAHLQPATLHYRLSVLAHKRRQRSAEALLKQLRINPEICDKAELIESLLNYETHFFRDASLFELLRSRILPELLGARPPQLRIWSAACASGQEPYSLVLIWDRHFAARASLRLWASDVSGQALELARQGLYSRYEVDKHVPAEYRSSFDLVEDSYQLQPHFRQQARFEQLNLLRLAQGAPAAFLPPDLDLMLMRNVLIYLAPALREKLIAMAARRLRPGGYLILGITESLVPAPPEFAPVHLDAAGGCFKKK
ncbi:MAG: protein-glutamate O-methyltransferase CheR [Candidatus Sericytochromatia bacterium]